MGYLEVGGWVILFELVELGGEEEFGKGFGVDYDG